ncbi:MAG: Hpt domain-containing protein [Acidobacteriia bacterium]|nr:Hpt domain-containing protein [Terriglobia bacterium]
MDSSPQNFSFNRQAALDRVGGDEELLKEIAELFLGEYPGLMLEMGFAVAGNDPDRLQRAAHTLKGSLGTLGAERAFPIALELEMKGRRNQMQGAKEIYLSLQNCMAQLHQDLSNL